MTLNIEKIRSLFGKSAILDNNILCDFIELDCLEILNDIFISCGVPMSILQDEVKLLGYKEKIDDELFYTPVTLELAESYVFWQTIEEKYRRLTAYDVEVVVLSKEKAVLCTSNERDIARACDEFGILSAGSVGILCCAYEHKVIDHSTFSLLVRKLFFQCSCWLSEGLKKEVFEHYYIPDRCPDDD